MEDDTRAFLVLIVNTIALILIWMIANVLAGIYFGLAFFTGRPGIWNIVYYILCLASLLYLARFVLRKWRRYL